MEKQYLDYEGLERFKSKLVLGDFIQVTELPSASAEKLGKVYQYIGATTSTLIHNYFYECVSDGESTPTYSWEQKDVQPGGGEIEYVEELPTSDITNKLYVLRYEEFVDDTVSGSAMSTYYDRDDFKANNGTVNMFFDVDDDPAYSGYLFKIKDEYAGKLFMTQNSYGTGFGELFAVYYINAASTLRGDDYGYNAWDESKTVKWSKLKNSSTVYLYDNPNYKKTYAGDKENQETISIEKPEWTGTHAAWDALSLIEKAKYHGCKVNFTDEDTGGIETVVDAVTDGDMHAVSSNAVYDRTDKITTYTNHSTGSGVTWREKPTVKICGRLVQFSGIIDSIADTSAQFITLLTGLPKPVAPMELVFSANDTTNVPIGIYFTGNGEMHAYERANAFYRVAFTYITKD